MDCMFNNMATLGEPTAASCSTCAVNPCYLKLGRKIVKKDIGTNGNTKHFIFSSVTTDFLIPETEKILIKPVLTSDLNFG